VLISEKSEEDLKLRKKLRIPKVTKVKIYRGINVNTNNNVYLQVCSLLTSM